MAAQRAKRQKLRGAIALIGPSGSGKTLGALLLAYGMMKEKYPDADDYDVWGKIGLIDSEHERALAYAGMVKAGVKIGEFWHVGLKAPYSVKNYTEKFNELKAEGVEVVVVDSTSHAWEGEGGVLDYQQDLGGRFQDWNTANKKAFAPLVKLFTGETHDLHVINTIRAKQEYAMQPDDLGKMQVVKLGTKPVQRDSFEYEFQVVFNVDMSHKASVSKDNSGLFEGMYEPLHLQHGKALYEWLEAGIDVFAEREAKRAELAAKIREQETQNDLHDWVLSMEQHPSINKRVEDLDLDTMNKLHTALQAKIAEVAQGGN